MKRLHMIGNAHIDAVWLWRWQEGFHEVHATFRSALDRMREYPGFVFTCSSAAYYEWVEQNDPAMFEEIRRRVREGRWVYVGGWWVEPDCNIPCGESFVRQALLGQRYFAKRFGARATVGYNVDSFGHHAMLPQLLVKSGLTSYVFMRPGEHERSLERSLFWWAAPDGSRVLAYRIPFAYTTWHRRIDDHIERAAELLDGEGPEGMCFYGVGDHGGGPTIENIESIHRLQETGSGVDLRMSSPVGFFASVRPGSAVPGAPGASGASGTTAALPTVTGELQHHSRGCYSAHSEVKRLNRMAENRLLTAERFEAAARLLTGARRMPSEGLTRAWKGVLFNQFHDVLAGTAIEAAYTDARELYGEALAIAGRSLNRSMHAISWAIDIPPEAGARPIVVFNPNAFDLGDVVEIELLHEGQIRDSGIRPSDRLFENHGTAIDHQVIQSEATELHRTRLCFHAAVPALGYRVYHLRPSNSAAPPAAPVNNSDATGAGGTAADVGDTAMGAGSDVGGLSIGDTWIENACLRLELDPATGEIHRLYDKSAGWEAIQPARATPAADPDSGALADGGAVVLHDASDTWSHGIDRYDEVRGRFTLGKMEVLERGPVRGRLRTTSHLGRSTLIRDYLVSARSRSVEVRTTLDWHETHALLKLCVPVAVQTPLVTCGIPFGVVRHPASGDEEFAHDWVDLSGTPSPAFLDAGNAAHHTRGLALIADTKYSYSVQGSTICLTVVRSPIYAHHEPKLPSDREVYRYMEQGEQQFVYRLLPHAGDWRSGELPRAAAELQMPLLPAQATFHPGRLGQEGRLLTVQPESLQVSAVKTAEEGEAVILRCHEASGARTSARIALDHLGVEITAELSPFEIKSFRLPLDEPGAWEEVDLIEEPTRRPPSG